jgi:CheY-like chemotaxis protein
MTYRIVLVDDETSIRRLLRAVLKGYTLFEAADGRTGLALIREVRPDIVLLDMMMPYLNGLQVAQKVLLDPTTASIPIIMLSARG